VDPARVFSAVRQFPVGTIKKIYTNIPCRGSPRACVRARGESRLVAARLSDKRVEARPLSRADGSRRFLYQVKPGSMARRRNAKDKSARTKPAARDVIIVRRVGGVWMSL